MDKRCLLITDRNLIRKQWQDKSVNIKSDIEIINKWLKTQKHLPELPTENMIEFILTNCKFSIEKAKKNLDIYYSIRSMIPELYENIDPSLPQNQAVFDFSFSFPLPRLTPSLERISIVLFKKVNSDLIDLNAWSITFMHNIYEVRLNEDLAMGEIFIFDLSSLVLSYLSRINPMEVKRAAVILEKVWSNRVKGIHFINVPPIADLIISILKAAVNKKIKDRIFIHGNLEELFQYIPKDILPSDYGGLEKSMEELNKLWKAKLLEYKERFKKLENMKVNENLRPAPLENSDILGYHGNFKKIEVD